MPKKIQPMGDVKFSSLAPEQVRISSVVEIGEKYLGTLVLENQELPNVVDSNLIGECEGCQRCQGCHACERCQSCQSCQSSMVSLLDKEIGLRNIITGPMRAAREVIYELHEADAEHGSAEIKQSRLILEMPEEAFEKLPEKERFLEIPTKNRGVKRYLLKETPRKSL